MATNRDGDNEDAAYGMVGGGILLMGAIFTGWSWMWWLGGFIMLMAFIQLVLGNTR